MVLEIIKFLFLEMRKPETNSAETENTACDIFKLEYFKASD